MLDKITKRNVKVLLTLYQTSKKKNSLFVKITKVLVTSLNLVNHRMSKFFPVRSR